MGDNDPTPRELLIQLQNLASQVSTLVRKVDDLTSTLGATYVPRGEWEEARKGDNRRFEEIEKDNSDQASFRRQATLAGLLFILGLLANLILSLVRIPGVGS